MDVDLMRLRVAVRRFIARRRAEQVRQRQAVWSVPAELVSDHCNWRQLLSTAVQPLTADHCIRQNIEEFDFSDARRRRQQNVSRFTWSHLTRCTNTFTYLLTLRSTGSRSM